MKALLLSTALLAIPAMASAVTLDVEAGDLNSSTQILYPHGVVSYTFNAIEAVVLSFSVAGTGSLANLVDVSYGSFRNEFTWTAIFPFGGLSSTVGTLASVTLAAGESYTVNFYDGIDNPVGITLSHLRN